MGCKTDVKIYDDKRQIVPAAMEIWKRTASGAAVSNGIFRVALSGGTTPLDLYRTLSDKKDGSIPWKETEVFMVDERFVPYEHKDSNYGMVKKSLLDPLEDTGIVSHPVPVSGMDVSDAADAYEQTLQDTFRGRGGERPVFDLIILGMGADGHTASLFAGHDALKVSERDVVPVEYYKVKHPRVSLSLPALNRARNIVVMAYGSNKSPAVKKAFKDKDRSLPVSMLSPEGGNITFLFDREAAISL